MKKGKVKKMIAQAQQDVHDYYRKLGVKVKTTVHGLELPTQVLQEGCSVPLAKLKTTQKAYIDENAIEIEQYRF